MKIKLSKSQRHKIDFDKYVDWLYTKTNRYLPSRAVPKIRPTKSNRKKSDWK